MRRLPPVVQTFLTYSGQPMLLACLAVTALILAPGPKALMENSAPVPPPVLAEAEPAGPVMRAITFAEPIPGRASNSLFGMRRLGGERGARMHKGVDIAAPTGTPILSTAEARVIRIGYDVSGYGNFVELVHPNGLTSLYGHMSRIDVASGDVLAAGQRVGLVGSTGYSTGPHLHFEVRRDGVQINPHKVIGRSFQVRATVPSR